MFKFNINLNLDSTLFCFVLWGQRLKVTVTHPSHFVSAAFWGFENILGKRLIWTEMSWFGNGDLSKHFVPYNVHVHNEGTFSHKARFWL